VTKPTTDILERIYKNSSEHNDGVYTRLFRYLLREDIYYLAYQKLYSNKGAGTKGIDNDTADGFGKKYVDKLIEELSNNTYQPKPVRREYIKKPNGKMRPLGIPSFRDKLLQEVIRNFLEAIYEPNFSNFSHGFRPKRSCHTALKQTTRYFNGAKWFIEGDIKGCFDNIDHSKLIEILQRKIKDSKFLNIIRSFLKAGYIEDFRYNKTYSGTPQGGILSPILANIYLNELDNKVMEIKDKFDVITKEQGTKEYIQIRSRKAYLKKLLENAEGEKRIELMEELKQMERKHLTTPYKTNTDKNIAFVRYADDFLIAVRGNKEDCILIKEELRKFLVNELSLELSEDKTLITHSSEKVKFLGYNISVRRNQQVFKNSLGRKIRSMNGKVELTVPLEKIEKFLFEKGIVKQTKAKTFRPTHRRGWLYLPDHEILERYNAEIRGILNYYNLSANFYKLSYFCYLMEYSCLATLAGKYNSSISKIISKNRNGGSWTIKYSTSKGMIREKRIFKLQDSKEICSDEIVAHVHNINTHTNATIRARIQAGICELCGTSKGENYEVHHVSKLKTLQGSKIWEQVMIKKNRKTLVVCENCHKAIHD
jgi:group II intron reverse transcriptase/maturase